MRKVLTWCFSCIQVHKKMRLKEWLLLSSMNLLRNLIKWRSNLWNLCPLMLMSKINHLVSKLKRYQASIFSLLTKRLLLILDFWETLKYRKWEHLSKSMHKLSFRWQWISVKWKTFRKCKWSRWWRNSRNSNKWRWSKTS